MLVIGGLCRHGRPRRPAFAELLDAVTYLALLARVQGDQVQEI
jgi:hypothetical protein